MLSCSCNEWDGEGWAYFNPDDFSRLKTKRRKRCISCSILIEKGAECLEFERFREPTSEIEERIYGDEVYLASYYHCGKCGEIYFNLTAAGFCINIDTSMENLLKEYHKLTGFKIYPYVWFWRKKLPERKGEPCRIVPLDSKPALNSVLIEFKDGFRVITSLNAIRKGK